LGYGLQAGAPALADEQVNPNERMLCVHVAKGGFCKKASSTLFKPPAATWFFQPLIGIAIILIYVNDVITGEHGSFRYNGFGRNHRGVWAEKGVRPNEVGALIKPLEVKN
jgi:hypothetical protein